MTPLLLAGYVFLGSLFPRTDFSQLARLVNVGHHYQLHLQEARQSGGEISFSNFFRIHYLQPALHEGEHEQDHGNLPFLSIASFVIHHLSQPAHPVLTGPAFFAKASPVFTNRLHLTGFPLAVFIPPSLF